MKQAIFTLLIMMALSVAVSAAEPVSASADAAATATGTVVSPCNDSTRSVAMLDFFVRARFPLSALEKTVEPVGDDIFAAERKGLERTLRRLAFGILRSNTKCNVQKLQSTENLGDAWKKVFMYYTAPPSPDGYFRIEDMSQIAQNLKADMVFAGVVEDLVFSDMGTPKEKVSLKVGFILFDAAESKFIYTKSFLKKLDDIKGFPDKSLLPRIQGRVPDDIDYFADSDTGRVFLSIAEDFLADFTGGDTKSYLGASFEGRDFEEESDLSPSASDRDDGDANLNSDTVTAECSDKGQAVVMSLPGSKEGLRIYACRDGILSLSDPESESEKMVSSPKGLSTLSRGDFDGDKKDELLVATHEPGQRIRLYKLDDRHLDIDKWIAEATHIFPDLITGVNAAAGDFDGDGAAEVAVSPDAHSDDVVILDYRDGAFDTQQPIISFRKNFAPSNFGATPAAGDFNGDGLDELVIASQGAGEKIRIFELPSGLKTRPKLIGDLSNFFGGKSKSVSVATGDFNGDGKDELAIGSMDHGVQVIVAEFKNGKFNIDEPMGYLNLNLTGSSAGARVFAGDFDGDGKDDLAVSVLGSDGELTVFRFVVDKFRLSNPYINSSGLYDRPRDGIILTVGKFN